MNWYKKLLVALALTAFIFTPAMAQFRIGAKAGIAINDLKFNKEVLESKNQKGFTGGIITEFTMPIIGVGVDASVLYARRSFDVTEKDGTPTTDNRDYLDIPINLKWKIGLPVVGKIVTPFITTGPDFSFLLSKKNISNAWHNKTVDTAWTVGAGVQFFNKLQIGATYGWGLTKSASNDDALYSKSRYWTITASFFFN